MNAMSWVGMFFSVYTTFGYIVRIAMIPTILRRQFAPGAAMAWLGIIFLHPYIGWVLYMLVGETRLGPHRVERHRKMVARYRCTPQMEAEGQSAANIVAPEYAAMVQQSEKISSLPAIPGNCVDFIGDAQQLIDSIVNDINAARSHVHLLYYIFGCDSSGVRVAGALRNAAARGVKCRLIADAVASRDFFHATGLAPSLESAGVEVTAALPVAPISRRLPRMDLRNHRKMAVIDDAIAYCGSQNIINADYGGRHGGPWVDLTARLTGRGSNRLGDHREVPRGQECLPSRHHRGTVARDRPSAGKIHVVRPGDIEAVSRRAAQDAVPGQRAATHGAAQIRER